MIWDMESNLLLLFFIKTQKQSHSYIVSTRGKQRKKKNKRQLRKAKSSKSFKKYLERLYGLNVEKDLNKLLSYKFSSIAQLELCSKEMDSNC